MVITSSIISGFTANDGYDIFLASDSQSYMDLVRPAHG